MMVLPPLIFAGFAAVMLLAVLTGGDDSLPTNLKGQPAPIVPDTVLGDLPGFTQADLADGQVKLVNCWASWCAPCRVEHRYIEELSGEVPVYGVNRDRTAEQAKGFLAELGDPYTGVVADPRNRQSIEWGVYALPETFVIDGSGKVVLHIRGPINEPLLEKRIKPALAAALAE